MRNVLILMCGVVMISSVAFAEDAVETCAGGAGTVVVGAVTGHKYCHGKKKMDWWNAYAWCDAMGRRLFDISDCACGNVTADCDNRMCPELVGVSTIGASNIYDRFWMNKNPWKGAAYRINIFTGDYRDTNPLDAKTAPALCY